MINGMTATLSDHAIYLELLCRGGRMNRQPLRPEYSQLILPQSQHQDEETDAETIRGVHEHATEVEWRGSVCLITYGAPA